MEHCPQEHVVARRLGEVLYCPAAEVEEKRARVRGDLERAGAPARSKGLEYGGEIRNINAFLSKFIRFCILANLSPTFEPTDK